MRPCILRTTAVIIFSTALLCSSQIKPGTSQKQEPPKATVSGKVVRASDGEPLKKAFVVLRKNQVKGQPAGATTDADGKFIIRDVEAGKYTLSVSRNGFVTQMYGQKSATGRGSTLTIGTGQEVKDLSIRLTAGGVIAGRVVDEDGEPVANVAVMPMRYTYSDGERQLQPAGYARTDDHGEYRLSGLQAREYYVSARFETAELQQGNSNLQGDTPADGYAPTYYPGTTDISRASAVSVKAGEDARADFVFAPVRTVKIRGHLIDGLTGTFAKSGNLMLTPKNSPVRWGADRWTWLAGDTDGAFEFRGVTPGSYWLTAYIWGDKPHNVKQEVEVGDTDISDLEITASAGREIAGHVRFEGKGDPNGIQVQLEISSSKNLPMGGAWAEAKPDGSFTLKGVAQDDYVLSVHQIDDDAYVKSAYLGQDDVLENGLDGSKHNAGTLEIVIGTSAGRVQGTVTDKDGKPFPAATVTLIPEKPGKTIGSRSKAVGTDQNGVFLMRGVRPGNYKLYAFEDIETGAEQDPEFIKKFESKAHKITVREGEAESAELKLIPAEGREE